MTGQRAPHAKTWSRDNWRICENARTNTIHKFGIIATSNQNAGKKEVYSQNEDPRKNHMLSKIKGMLSRACYRQIPWSICYVLMPMRGYMFVLLLLGDEVLAVFEAFDLELVALGSGVNVLDVVCRSR